MEDRIDKFSSLLTNKIHEQLNLEFDRCGLKLRAKNYFYLDIINDEPGISQAYFIELLHRDQSVVTRQINRLVKDGWLKKTYDPTDHRRSQLYLTDKAKSSLPEIRQLKKTTEEKILACLEPFERELFKNLLKKVAINYKVQLIE